MSVFNSFTGSCENIPTSNISEYYNTVGEYFKSTVQHLNEDQNTQNTCPVVSESNTNLWLEPTLAGASKAQCAYAQNHNVVEYVQIHNVPNSAQSITQNTPRFYNMPYVQQNNCNVDMRYRHYLHAKKHNSLKVNMKKKRKRTIFTTEQIVALEAIFQKKPYISREERVVLMQKLQVSEKSIKVWFQNRRRLTDKKDKDYESGSPSSEDSSETNNDRLAHIESQIQRNTDQYGYVTLDNKVMSDLVTVIDEYLSQDVSWNQCLNANNQTTILKDEVGDEIVMYEPISPVSLTEVLEEYV